MALRKVATNVFSPRNSTKVSMDSPVQTRRNPYCETIIPQFCFEPLHETQKLSEKALVQLQIKKGVLNFVTITSIRCKNVQESKNQFRSVEGLLQTAENISWNTFLEVFLFCKKNSRLYRRTLTQFHGSLNSIKNSQIPAQTAI